MSGGCFDCRNCDDEKSHIRKHPGVGWVHPCKKGLPNEHIKELEDAEKCPEFDPRVGFYIGGYHTHMWFVYDKTQRYINNDDPCLEWQICSDLEFPTKGSCREPVPDMEIHLCDFRQLEHFVKFWGRYLRKIGFVTE